MSGSDEDRRGIGFPSGWKVDRRDPVALEALDQKRMLPVPQPKGWVDVPKPQLGADAKGPLTPEQEALATAFVRALERAVGTVAMAPHQDVPIRGDTWEADSELGVIVSSSDAVSGNDADLAAVIVAAATGASYTLANPVGIVVATFTVPDGYAALVDDVRVRADSEIGYRLVKFTLEIGGSRSRSLNQRVQSFDRDAPTRIRRLAAPGQIVRLLATNTDAECAHLVEGVIRGWFFPLTASLKALIQF